MQYTLTDVYALAVRLDTEYSLTELVLNTGDAAWNPTSSKPERVLRGPGTVGYLIHSTGVETYHHAAGTCLGSVRDDDGYPMGPCGVPADRDSTRCAAHQHPGQDRHLFAGSRVRVP